MNLQVFDIINGVYTPANQKPGGIFEEKYIGVRQKEHRLYSDNEVKHLPGIAATHPLYDEWMIRKESCKRLIKYLQGKTKLTIAEIGSGNGWLCNQLSSIEGSKIYGIDVNYTELQQAAR